MKDYFDKKIVRSILISLRKKNKLTQSELESALNLSKGLVSHYETGRNDLSMEVIVKYANFFNVSTDYILNRCESETDYSKFIDKEIADHMTIGNAIALISKMSKKEASCFVTIIKKFSEKKQ